MLDILFLILITIFVPIILITGIVLYKPTNSKKIIVAVTLALLGLELLRFFYNASFYSNGATPKADLKFGYITILCILSLFATFNKSKFCNNFIKEIFCLTCLTPLILGIFNPNVYVNTLDTYAICKAIYMLESGVVLALTLLYVYYDKIKINVINILWAIVTVLLYTLINSFVSWYWEIEILFNLNWYLSLAISIVLVVLLFIANYIYNKHKKSTN